MKDTWHFFLILAAIFAAACVRSLTHEAEHRLVEAQACSIQALEQTVKLKSTPCPKDTVYIDLGLFKAGHDEDYYAEGPTPWKTGRQQ